MADDPVGPNPTYMADIRHFFRPQDVRHMGDRGIHIGTYEDLKANATNVLGVVMPPGAFMPPDADGKWSANRAQTFKNWIVNKCPEGTATPQPGGGTTPGSGEGPADRVRKNVASLSADEIATLKTAFTGIMDREPTDPNSYFALAGIHGRPRLLCLHHQDRYAPWHRAYLRVFEDQLRTVPGCEDVTMPYWDLSTPLPDLLQQPPFDSYALPQDVPGIPPDYKTERYTPQKIIDNLNEQDVLEELGKSLEQSKWGVSGIGGYQLYSIQAHDGGHGSIGPTMAKQERASYDPVFWFFHANLDRLWVKWQQNVGATTFTTFLSTVSADHKEWWSAPFNELKPWTAPTSDGTIAFGIAYEDTAEEIALENRVGSIQALHAFAIRRSTPVSVRVKNIDRSNIPGSFAVHLLADGEPIKKRFFFQPTSPKDCEGCRESPLVNITFDVDQEEILDRKLSIQIEVPGLEDEDKRFPVSRAGSPTINARLMLEEE
ncbi:MAG: tyrosinase family protein [Actinomycetota bacterium]|nr:tyrosinase family protein [Actinomycetota bacterium]